MNNKKDIRIKIENHDEEFLFQKNLSKLNISFNRISFIFFVFFIICLIYSIHLTHLGSRKVKFEINDYNKYYSNKLYRADIIDRNGNYLVKTVSSIDIGISTKKIIDKKKLLLNLKYIFPNKDYKSIQEKIDTKKFFWFEKKISDENYEKIMKLGDKSIQPQERLVRIYPSKNLFSHIIGQIDDNNNGISGLEKSLDEDLKKSKEPIKLSVDRDIQFLIRNELIKFKVK